MNDTLQKTMTMIQAVTRAADIKVSRGFADYVADQIVKAGTEQSLLGFIERFSGLLHSEIERIGGNTTAKFLSCINAPDASGVLSWFREYPRMVAMIAILRSPEDFQDALEMIEIQESGELGTALPGCTPNTPMIITCLSPLSTGADRKAGNSTLYRRQECLSTTGKKLILPIFPANEIRGIMRDLLADDFTKKLGFSLSRVRNPEQSPYSEWFFYALYSGGKLEENSAEAKALAKEMGSNGTVKIAGYAKFRDMVPPLSVLGCALGNQTISRCFDNLDAKPRCQEWNSGDLPAAELFTWEFLTHKDDMERPKGEKKSSVQMIANTECLELGTILDGGIDILEHPNEIERACIGKGLALLQEKGKLGAENRRAFGNVKIEYPNGIPDATPYDEYMVENKETILAYLESIGALKRQGDLL